MNRRLHERSLADLEVQVTTLTGSHECLAGKLADVSGAGLCVMVPHELEPEEVVKLEAADSTLFGYVIYSSRQGNAFRTGVEVQRVLLGGTDLAGLLRSVLQETMPDVAGVAAE